MNLVLRTALLVITAILFSTTLFASEKVSKSRLTGVAIGGKDTVAYHTLERAPQASAVKGNKAFVVTHKGAKWRFGSQKSADLFAENPDKYSPAYNGHCANALSLGEGLIRTDGTHWEIFGNQLYLFYAGRGRTRWLGGDWQAYKVEADAAWEKL